MFNFVIAGYVFLAVIGLTLLTAGWGWITIIVFRLIKNAISERLKFSDQVIDNITFVLTAPFAIGIPFGILGGIMTAGLK